MNYFESIYASDLPHRDIAVFMYLVQRANKDGQCWPSEGRIAMDLSMSRSTVKRAVNDLRKAGYIQTEKRLRPNGTNSSLLYRIPDFENYRTTKG